MEGILVITLDPPVLGFTPTSYVADVKACWKQVTVDEIKDVLIELGALKSGQSRMPKECIIRLHGHYSEAWLERHGLQNRFESRHRRSAVQLAFGG